MRIDPVRFDRGRHRRVFFSAMRTLSRFAALLFVCGLAVTAGCASQPVTPVPMAPADPEGDLRTLLKKADAAFDSRAYDQAEDRYKAVYIAARTGNFAAIMAESSAQAATITALREEMLESDEWMSVAESAGSPGAISGWTRVLLARGVRDWKRSDNARARGSFIELYNYCALHDLLVRQIQAANLAAVVSVGQEQLDWSLRAIQAAQASGESKWEAPLWSSHAWLLDDRGQYGDALRAFARARELTADADVTPIARMQTDWALAHGLRKVGRLDEARRLLERTNSIAQSIYISNPTPRAAEHLGRILWELAEVEALEGRKEKARELYAAARAKLVEAGAMKAAPEVLRELDECIERLDRPVPPGFIPRRKRNG
jgi:tetratricopeptide (TPR) repeat protein